MTRSTTGADNGTPDGAPDGARRRDGVLSRRLFLAIAGGGVAALSAASAGAAHLLARLHRVGTYPPEALEEVRGGASPLLFRRHPALARAVPWRPLGAFPTPIEELPLPEGSRAARLLVKRDDLTAGLYGGNKVRKLEHLLAEAELAGCESVVTLGGTGTNHGLATALHGRALGLDVSLALYEQPPGPAVDGTLAALQAAGARVVRREGEVGAFLAARELMLEERAAGRSPYFINVGGTSRLGTVGYVNAALELAEQVRTGVLPAPDRIFVALGTSGTAAGLLAGLDIAGLDARLCAVRVTGLLPANRLLVAHFARDVARWLHELDPTVPAVQPSPWSFDLSASYRGPGYGIATHEAREAIAWAAAHLALEPTYTGKALAACLAHCRSEEAASETVLFWNTFSPSASAG